MHSFDSMQCFFDLLNGLHVHVVRLDIVTEIAFRQTVKNIVKHRYKIPRNIDIIDLALLL